MGWLRWVGPLNLKVSFAIEPYETEYILVKRPIFLRRLVIVATPYVTHVRRHQTCRSSWCPLSHMRDTSAWCPLICVTRLNIWRIAPDMSHKWTSHVARMIQMCHTSKMMTLLQKSPMKETLFWKNKRALWKRLFSGKETYNFKMCHTYERAPGMPHIWLSHVSSWFSCVTHMRGHESCRTYA